FAAGLDVSISDSKASIDPVAGARFFETVSKIEGVSGPLHVQYSFDVELMGRIFKLLKRANVRRGHVVVLDVQTGRLIAYASADSEALPPQRSYPAASLAKFVTGAASLEKNRTRALQPCLYRGNPHRLTKSRVHPRRGGNKASFESAMAKSNNQCFAQLAVHALGAEATVAAFEQFGWTRSPARGHDAGSIERGEGDYGLGKLGSGLAPSRITALYAAQLVATLDTGELVEPWWIDRVVNEDGQRLALPERGKRRRVMRQSTADELRKMLVRTTRDGTARRAFRTPRGYRLGKVEVAGKTGSLTGRSPQALYEWFAGIAPADAPRIAVAVLQAKDDKWHRYSTEIAADVLAELFCRKRLCRSDYAARYTEDPGAVAAPVFLNEIADAR
ncbi:MAG: penicillin-binding transpeptidase domain-containing protein, partial [Myxococcota bacterium]|nr:penicillin-binding transpeptidase domain-containing protein [Myxococcota bacterium]